MPKNFQENSQEKFHETWPPSYELRFSKKAKRAIVYIKRAGLIEIALPTALNNKKYDNDKFIKDLLEKNKIWILKQVKLKQKKEAQQTRPTLSNLDLEANGFNNANQSESEPYFDATNLIPKEIYLLATKELISVSWNKKANRNAYCLMPSDEHGALNLIISTKDALTEELEAKSAVKLLQTWLKAYALRVFEPQVYSLATRYDFAVSLVKTRLQQTRLGSCNRRGVINLNAATLFFPPELVTHLILHELCHLKEMNHGQNFWKLLATMDEFSLKNDKALKKYLSKAPNWIFAK